MMMTFAILAYFYYEELKNDWSWKDLKGSGKKFLRSVLHYFDYLLLPVIWYFGDKLLFPGYGVYDGHSYILWEDLVKNILNSPITANTTFWKIISSYSSDINGYKIIRMAAVLIIVSSVALDVYYTKFRNRKDTGFNTLLKDVLMTVIGSIVFFLGFFPYSVKRTTSLVNTYIDGRDTLLLGIGSAIILYYAARVLFRRNINRSSSL